MAPQRAGLPGLNSGGAAAAVPPSRSVYHDADTKGFSLAKQYPTNSLQLLHHTFTGSSSAKSCITVTVSLEY